MALLFLILAVLLVAAAESRLYRTRAFCGFQYRCYFSTPEAREGDEVELVEELVNRKLLPIPWLRSDFSTSKWLDFAGTRSVVTDETRYVVSFFLLGSYRMTTRRWKVKCRKRGVYSVDKVQLMASDLLGFTLASQSVETDARLLVLPNPDLPQEPQFKARHLLGEVMVRRQLADDPFTIAGIREYQDGDPMNRINWPATARTGRLMVRECDFTTSPSLAVLLNLQSRDFERDRAIEPEAVENAIRVCAGLFQEAAFYHLPVEFRCNAKLPDTAACVATLPGSGPEHTRELLRLLAQLPLKGSEDFTSWLSREAGTLDSTDRFVVTAYLTPELLAFAQKREDTAMLVIGFPEEAPPVPPGCRVVFLGPYFREKEAAS